MLIFPILLLSTMICAMVLSPRASAKVSLVRFKNTFPTARPRPI